jgi:hypothetical protein
MIPFIFDGGETMRDGNSHLSGEKRKEEKKGGGGRFGVKRRWPTTQTSTALHCSHVLRVTEQLCMAERRDMAKEARNVTEKRLVILMVTDGTTNADHLGDCGNLRA